jgi:hypothetical protein
MKVRRILFPLPFLLFPCLLAGCSTVLGVAAAKLAPPEKVKPQYTNLAGQSIGVMVWIDRGIRIDWPGLQLDLANSIDKQLRDQTADAKGHNVAKTLLGSTYPVLPASIIRYQMDHPEIEAMQMVDVAPKLGVQRLIYVEVEDFDTRADRTVELFRGSAKATVRVFEIEKDGTAKIAFEKNNVVASFPPKAQPEGVPNLGDAKTYAGTLDAFATEIVHLFVPYEIENPY